MISLGKAQREKTLPESFISIIDSTGESLVRMRPWSAVFRSCWVRAHVLGVMLVESEGKDWR